MKKLKVKSFSCVLTHYDPCNLPGFSVHGLFQARILEWIAISFSRGIYPTQGSNLVPPTLQKYVIILIVFFPFFFGFTARLLRS